MALQPKTLQRLNNIIARFIAYLKYLSVGPQSLTKRELRDLARAGMIGKTAPRTAVALSYLKTHEQAAAGDFAPKATRDGAIDFLERSFTRYAEKAGTQFGTDIVNQIESQIMPFTDRSEGKAVYDVLRDRDVHKKYLGNVLNEQVKNWSSRWKLIVNTELSRASNYGAMDAIIHNNKGQPPEEINVYKIGPGDGITCGEAHGDKSPGCWEFWFMPDKKTPKVYKLSELMANGTNIGRKRRDWKATIDTTHPNCFTEGKTPVLTETGWKPIKDIGVGEKVLSHTGKYRLVTRVINADYRNKSVIKVSYLYLDRVQTVRVTPDHKFLTSHGWWIEAKDLSLGSNLMQLVSLNGKFIPCPIIKLSQSMTGVFGRVYCLTVEEDESFIARGIVSHNCRHVLAELRPGMGFNKDGLGYISKDHDEHSRQNPIK